MDRLDRCLNFSYILPGQCLIKSASFINKVSCWLNYVHLCGNFDSFKGYEPQEKKKKDTINIQISKSLVRFLMEEIFTLTQYLRRLILARKGDKEKRRGLLAKHLPYAHHDQAGDFILSFPKMDGRCYQPCLI